MLSLNKTVDYLNYYLHAHLMMTCLPIFVRQVYSFSPSCIANVITIIISKATPMIDVIYF